MIPLPTTHVTVLRPRFDPDRDGADEPLPLEEVARDVRATIGAWTGSESVRHGSSERVVARLVCDPIPGGLTHRDVVVDQSDGVRYTVDSARLWPGGGLVGWAHHEAQLRDASGGSR